MPNDARADWRAAWALFGGEVAYVRHGALQATTVAESLAACGFDLRAQIVWAKDAPVLGRGHYHRRHEPCWHAVRAGGRGHWQGDRSQTTLWEVGGRGQDAATVHGTQKPVECMRRPIENNGAPGDAVYEPFSGSGTTIIAAETTGRACRAVELDPRCVDVAVRRWQALTGGAAVLEGDGRHFAAVAEERLAAAVGAWCPPPRTGGEGRPRPPRTDMAPRGRKPKSLAEERLTGTLRKHPVAPAVPEPPGGELPCPLEVEKNPRAAAYWGMYLASTAPGHLAPLDAPLLARLCMAPAYADEVTAQVQAVGLLAKAPNAKLPIQSPRLAIVNRQAEIARKLAAELAPPPAQRSRAGMAAPRGAALPDDEWSI